MRPLIAAAVAGLAVLSSCKTPGLIPTQASGEPAGESSSSPLTREMALARAREVSRVSYALWFALDAKGEEYQGRVAIGFELAERAEGDLLVDFEDGAVRALSINGVAVPAAEIPKRYDGHRLRFATGELVRGGANRIEIEFAHATSTTGNGLHRFEDPADGRVYVYSNFEPYNANRMFPCFDQPDLKASYELTVEAPSEWTVISNTQE
ncbi:MAG: aminopeptidase N, partial [Gaiellaceae bacterium]